MNNKKLILILPTLIVAVMITLLLLGLADKGELKNASSQPKPFPSFQLNELQTGEQLTETLFTQQTNDQYRLLNVWASWCIVCATEHPFLVTLAEQGVNIIGLNYRDKEKAASAVLSNTGDPYQQIIFDPNGKLALDLGVIGTPETYLVNKQGLIIGRYNGVLTATIWTSIFKPLIDLHIIKEE